MSKLSELSLTLNFLTSNDISAFMSKLSELSLTLNLSKEEEEEELIIRKMYVIFCRTVKITIEEIF
jgi:uncharacterized protein YnzC (UPF0291/DUF896 family)